MPRIGTSAARGARAISPQKPKAASKPNKFDHTNFAPKPNQIGKSAIESAAKTGKPMVIKVGASWCGPCRKMKEKVFKNDDIAKQLKDKATFVDVEVDRLDDSSAEIRMAKTIASKLGARSYPTVFIATLENKNGKPVPKIISQVNNVGPEAFNNFLNDPNNGLKAAAQGIRDAGFGPQQ